MKNEKLLKLVMTGVFAALSYVVFTFLQIKITLPGGAIGMTIGDLLDPVYVVYAPKTFVLKFCIGLITGVIAHRLGHISAEKNNGKVLKWTIAATVGGLLFNVIFDPLIGYFYKLLILGKPAAELTLAWNVASTSINAVTSTIVSIAVYMALRPALKKSGLFFTIGKSKQQAS